MGDLRRGIARGAGVATAAIGAMQVDADGAAAYRHGTICRPAGEICARRAAIGFA